MFGGSMRLARAITPCASITHTESVASTRSTLPTQRRVRLGRMPAAHGVYQALRSS
jgi:hypothetical protein